MLSSSYRIRLENICEKIIKGESVELSDIIWAEKLSQHNRSAASILRKARREYLNPGMTEDSLDGFLNALDLGNPDPREHRTRFDGADDIADFFHNDDSMRRD
jgi:hypothetical protein